MNITFLRDYCLQKPFVTESFPFDKNTLVFKVSDKMFALVGLESYPISVNLKCDPELAITYRESYHAVTPGYHMSKKHWNTVLLESDVPDVLLRKMIDDSYALVVASMPKKVRDTLV